MVQTTGEKYYVQRFPLYKQVFYLQFKIKVKNQHVQCFPLYQQVGHLYKLNHQSFIYYYGAYYTCENSMCNLFLYLSIQFNSIILTILSAIQVKLIWCKLQVKTGKASFPIYLSKQFTCLTLIIKLNISIVRNKGEKLACAMFSFILASSSLV